jgi:hypothetical protein
MITFTSTVFKKNGVLAGRFHFDTREAEACSHAKGWVASNPNAHYAVVTDDKGTLIKEYGTKFVASEAEKTKK